MYLLTTKSGHTNLVGTEEDFKTIRELVTYTLDHDPNKNWTEEDIRTLRELRKAFQEWHEDDY